MTVRTVQRSHRAEAREDTISDRSLAYLILAASLLSASHSPWILIPLAPLVVAAGIGWDRWPRIWILSALVGLVVTLLRWYRYEDHVFFGLYQLLAVGIALTLPDFRRSLGLQLRWLTGALFGLAVGWKLLSTSYLSGDVFRTVALVDQRFDPVVRLVGGVTQAAIDANREVAITMAAQGQPSSTAILEATGYTRFAAVIAIWTILIESIIAVCFLLPDGNRLSRLRHPALILFGLTTYTLVPVLGFATMLAAVGISLRPRQLYVWLYILMAVAPIVRGLIIL